MHFWKSGKKERVGHWRYQESIEIDENNENNKPTKKKEKESMAKVKENKNYDKPEVSDKWKGFSEKLNSLIIDLKRTQQGCLLVGDHKTEGRIKQHVELLEMLLAIV